MNDTTTTPELDDTDYDALVAEMTAARNADVLAGVPRAVVERIIACDPRVATVRPNGVYEITEEDGTIRVVTVDQYLTEHEIDRTEVFYATVDEFIAGIASVNIPALDAVDVLLDLRRLFGAVEAEHKEFIRGMHGVIGGLLESQRGAE